MFESKVCKKVNYEGKCQSNEGSVRHSIALRLVRHAESKNNEVYRQARHSFKGGTPDYDESGWTEYVDTHRLADPGISKRGQLQAEKLRDYLVPHLLNQASYPVRIITSPMKRALETILPTLIALNNEPEQEGSILSNGSELREEVQSSKYQVIVNAFYHESDGCHIREVPETGMNQPEIREFMSPVLKSDISFEGFSNNPKIGWYHHGTGSESRLASEARAAKFYLWLCEYLDQQLESGDDDVFDAGVSLPSEMDEVEQDKASARLRRRRTAILMGHADFMGLVLKRAVAGFGHSVEMEGVPHRSAFVHFNTGMTELEYFGKGRFLIMNTNQTPHLNNLDDHSLKTGGGLKDGWSYIMPPDEFVLYQEVSVAFEDELEDHVKEQTDALKELYLSRHSTGRSSLAKGSAKSKSLCVVEEIAGATSIESDNVITTGGTKTFVVKRGLQVVACATYSNETGLISDVVIRPSARGSTAAVELFDAIKSHATTKAGLKVLLAKPANVNEQAFFEEFGFEPISTNNNDGMIPDDVIVMQWKQ